MKHSSPEEQINSLSARSFRDYPLNMVHYPTKRFLHAHFRHFSTADPDSWSTCGDWEQGSWKTLRTSISSSNSLRADLPLDITTVILAYVASSPRLPENGLAAAACSGPQQSSCTYLAMSHHPTNQRTPHIVASPVAALSMKSTRELIMSPIVSAHF